MNAYEGENNVNLRATLLRIRQNNDFTLNIESQYAAVNLARLVTQMCDFDHG